MIAYHPTHSLEIKQTEFFSWIFETLWALEIFIYSQTINLQLQKELSLSWIFATVFRIRFSVCDWFWISIRDNFAYIFREYAKNGSVKNCTLNWKSWKISRKKSKWISNISQFLLLFYACALHLEAADLYRRILQTNSLVRFSLSLLNFI